MQPGDVRVFQRGKGNALVIGLGVWAKRSGKKHNGKWIDIHLAGPNDSLTTVTNNPKSKRYHRTFFRNLRRTLIQYECWSFGDEGLETESK